MGWGEVRKARIARATSGRVIDGGVGGRPQDGRSGGCGWARGWDEGKGTTVGLGERAHAGACVNVW